MIEKDSDRELPVPIIWRDELQALANIFVKPDRRHSYPASLIDPEVLKISLTNINDYPCKLGNLHESTWDTSIYKWMNGYWDVLVDLSDEFGEVTDLVFHAKVEESENGYVIKAGLVYVP